jgi:hypothetical protein
MPGNLLTTDPALIDSPKTFAINQVINVLM